MAALLLTGASGYVGAAIAAALRLRGVAFDCLAGRLEALQPHTLERYAKVIHAAGAPRYRGHPAVDTANRIGTLRLLAALEPAAPVLFISTRLVYGAQPGRCCRECDPVVPRDDYSLAKLAAEQLLGGSGREHVILRVPGLIGDSPAGVGHNFLAHALQAFFSGRPVVRHAPDRIHDNLDVNALAQLCADWAGGTCKLPEGVNNFSGKPRSLFGTLGTFATVAARFGARPEFVDRVQPVMPWPLMDDRRLRTAVDVIDERSDEAIAAACCARLAHTLPGRV